MGFSPLPAGERVAAGGRRVRGEKPPRLPPRPVRHPPPASHRFLIIASSLPHILSGTQPLMPLPPRKAMSRAAARVALAVAVLLLARQPAQLVAQQKARAAA